MNYYRVTLIGQITGRPYTYSVPLSDDVPPIAAKEVALVLHGEAIDSGEVLETVYKQGVKIRHAPRCWSLRARRWRLVRCMQDHAHEKVTKWHYTPKGDAWRVKDYE